MFGSTEQDIKLPTQIQVHLTYQTAFVDDAGKLQIRPDLYNLDSRTLAEIKIEHGKIDPAPSRKREQETASDRSSRSAGTGTNFHSTSSEPAGYPRPRAPIYR
jgi:hypothetical protein